MSRTKQKNWYDEILEYMYRNKRYVRNGSKFTTYDNTEVQQKNI